MWKIEEKQLIIGFTIFNKLFHFSAVTIKWNNFLQADLPCCAVARVIEQCCFKSTPDPFNGQTANFTLKPPKVIESTTYVKKANLEYYWNNTVLLLWGQHNRASLYPKGINETKISKFFKFFQLMNQMASWIWCFNQLYKLSNLRIVQKLKPKRMKRKIEV